MAALKFADLAVFLVDGTPSWGVPLELQYVATLDKPLVFLDLLDKDLPIPVYLQELLARLNCNPFYKDTEDELVQQMWRAVTASKVETSRQVKIWFGGNFND